MRLTALSVLAAAAVAASLPPHPRLLLDDAAMATLRARVQADSALQGFYETVRAQGIAALSTPPIPYPNCTVVGACRNAALFGAGANYIDAGGAQNTILTCALLHRLGLDNVTSPTEPSPWSQRAIEELLNLVSFPSWYHPVGQALERAELAFAAAIGYDWLFSLLTPAQRGALETAIGTLVLETRLRDEREGMWWTQEPLNWNINSNSPLLSAAFAIADVPAWSGPAQQVVQIVLANVPAAVASFAGKVWPEGFSYAGYTTTSLLHGAEAYASATGLTTGWFAAPGVCDSGLSIMYATGPLGAVFNYADAHGDTKPVAFTLMYLAQVCNTPVYAAAARGWLAQVGGVGAETVMWYSDAGSAADVAALPTAAVYADPSLDPQRGPKTHFASFRSAWNDPNATWVAGKGGNNFYDLQFDNNHGHLDIGSFVLESRGFRWAIDMGPDSYDYPTLAIFGRFRFGYALPSSVSHNVLVFDADTQHRRGVGRIAASDVSSPAPWALVDTTSAYGGSVSVLRNFSLDGEVVTVADRWMHPTAANATFQFHTTAAVQVNGASAVLLAPNGARMQVTASSPAGPCIWTSTLFSLPQPQTDTYLGQSVSVVSVTVPATAGAISVSFTPQ